MKFRGSRERLLYSLRMIPHVLSGRHQDALGIHDVFWTIIGNEVLRLVQRDYAVKKAGGRTAATGKWKPLAESTLERRRRKGITSEDIMVESARLMESLRAGVDDRVSGAIDQIFDVGPAGVTVGTATPYVDYHQTGVPGRLPARPVVPKDLPPQWEPHIERAMERALKKVVQLVCDAGGID